MSHTPGIYHRLALALSFLYIISGSITSVLYGFGTFDSYITVLALLTFVVLWRLVPYTTRVDVTNPLSRAGRHFVFVSSFMIIWLLPAILSFSAIFEGDPTKQTPVVVDCVPVRFMKLLCVPAGMDVILAFAIFGILVRASWTIFHRAIAIHGEANMALPADTPHPANLYPLKFYPPGSEVPVWMLAHMADVEQDADAEGAVGLV
ncbi:hypothetical protein DFH08DRAFT_1088206 [Mycena albidolilacea]|uniref:Uncharacterized protein n=1 Tax=Mycena albidolilacea TaxID=1033008 RepID=A0AAD7EBS6_9AGAR|nr:hypothetical protein DFH08DRAFT_1088206 [Mycena albidolilacea]